MFIFTIGPVSAVVHCHEVGGFKYLMRFPVFVVVSHVSESTGIFLVTYCKKSAVQGVS